MENEKNGLELSSREFNKRLEGWNENLLSIKGRITLLNVVLSAIQIYMMSVLKMPTRVRQKIDKIN